jgi:TolB-like protein
MKARKIFSLIFVLFLLVSCSHKKDIKKTEFIIKKPAKVVVMPFVKVTDELQSRIKCKSPDKLVVCSYKTEQFRLIGRKLATKFYFALEDKRKDYEPVDLDDVENAFQKDIVQINVNEIADRFKVDYIIEGYVYKFIERKGSEYSVEEPAMVHFVVVIRNAITGEVVWQKDYYEKQKELSKNLLNVFNFFKRKGRWLTALELAEHGINKIVNELP